MKARTAVLAAACAVLGYIVGCLMPWSQPAGPIARFSRSLPSADQPALIGGGNPVRGGSHRVKVRADGLPQIDRALQEAGRKQNLQERLAMVTGAADAVPNGDIPAALGRLHEVSGVRFKLAYARKLLTRWAAYDPKAASDWVRQQPHGYFRQATLETVAGIIGRDDPVAALNLAFADEGSGSTIRLRDQIYRQWANTDALTAIESMMQVETGSMKQMFLASMIGEWTRQDPAEATAWVCNLPPGTARQEALRSWLTEIGTTDPDVVSKFVASLPEGAFAQDAASILAATWAQGDIEGAVAWAKSLPEGDMKEAALSNVLALWAEADPAAAAAYAGSLSSDRRAQWVAGIASQWAQNDPAGAVHWAEGLPPGERDSFLKVVASNLAQNAPAKAAEIVAKLPPGSLRDEASIAVVEGWVNLQPQGAADWIGRLPDENLRLRATCTLMASWASRDSEQARHWAQSLPIGPMREAAFGVLGGTSSVH